MNLIITPNIAIQGLLFDEQISSIISNATKYGLKIYAPTTLYSDISSNYPYIQSKRSLDRAELVNLYNQLSKSLNLYFYPFNEPIIEVPRESRESRIFYNFDKYLSLAKFLGADAVWDGNTFDDLPKKYDSLPNKSLIYGIPIISSNKLFKIINENSIINETTYRTYFLGLDKPSAPFYPENQAQKSTKSLIEMLTQQLTAIYKGKGTPEIVYHLGTSTHRLMNSDYVETNIFVPIFALVSYLWLDKPEKIDIDVVFSYRTFSKGKGDRIRKVKQEGETGEEETVEVKIAGPDLNQRIFYSRKTQKKWHQLLPKL